MTRNYLSGSIKKALAIIECVGKSPKPLKASQVSLMTKLDRASMNVSLEARVPLLDNNLIDFAFKLNQKYKIRNGHSKWILKKVLEKYLPKNSLVFCIQTC